MHGKPTVSAPASPLDARSFKHITHETLRHRDLDRMRHVNNVSTISLYEDGWARFLEDGGLGDDKEIEWRVDYLGINFRKELFYRDDVKVGTRLSTAVDGSVLVDQTLFRGNEPAGSASRLATPTDRRSGAVIGLAFCDHLPIFLDGIEKFDPASLSPAPFRPSPDNSAMDPNPDYPIWREDTFRFADLDADERIGRLALFELIESARITVIQDAGAPTDDPDVIWLAAHVALNFFSGPGFPGAARTGLRMDGFGRSSCRVRHTIYSDARPVASGGAIVALANRKTYKTVEIPEATRDRLTSPPGPDVAARDRYDPARIFRD